MQPGKPITIDTELFYFPDTEEVSEWLLKQQKQTEIIKTSSFVSTPSHYHQMEEVLEVTNNSRENKLSTCEFWPFPALKTFKQVHLESITVLF